MAAESQPDNPLQNVHTEQISSTHKPSKHAKNSGNNLERIKTG
jgi:hypothetical protein